MKDSKKRCDSVAQKANTSILLLAGPFYFLPLLIGDAGSVWASCNLTDDVYTCSGVSINNGRVRLGTSAANPTLNVLVEPTYDTTNTNTTFPDNEGLHLNSSPGHGDINLTQAAGSSITSVGDGLDVFNDSTGSTTVTLFGRVTSSAEWAVDVSGNSQSGDVTFKQEGGRLEGNGGATVSALGTGSLNIAVASEIVGREVAGLLLHSGVSAKDMRISQAATSLIRSNGELTGAVSVRHDGTGSLLLDLDGAIVSTANAVSATDRTGGAGRGGVKIESFNRSGSIILNQADTGSIVSSANGILLRNDGIGISDVSTRGSIDASGGFGVYVENGATATDLIIRSLGNVTSRLTAIAAINIVPANAAQTPGATSVLIDGNVNSTASPGVHAQHMRTGDLLISQAAGTISGSTSFQGISARNTGSGSTTVNTLGTVTGATGIEVAHSSPSDIYVTQQAGSINGRQEGIYVSNTGSSGATSISTAGTVVGATGVQVNHTGTGDINVTQQAGSINGNRAGIYVTKSGVRGGASIATAGNVIGTAGQGVRVTHEGTGDLVVNQTAGTISGGSSSHGIFAYNGGSGATEISTSGKVTGAAGVQVSHFSSGDVSYTQQGGSIQGGLLGVNVINNGSGATSITIAGDVTSSADAITAAAVAADNRSASSSLSITQTSGKIQGAGAGLYVANRGLDGKSQIDIHNVVEGGTDAGITVNAINGATLNIHQGAVVSAGSSGVSIQDLNATSPVDGRISSGNLALRSTGSITGDALLGLGDDIVHLMGGSFSGNIYGDKGNTAGNQDAAPEGNETFSWTAGSFVGGFYGQGGSDTATISTGTYDGTQMLDGGDNTSIADGMIDTLNFQGISTQSAGANIVNWEVVNLDASSLRISDGAWTVGMPDETTTGISLTNGAMLDAMAALDLRANIDIDGTSTFLARGNGRGIYSIMGNVSNTGAIDTQDGIAGDSVTIIGDYAGNGGSILLDVVLNADMSAADLVEITGNASGTTYVKVANTGGTGAQTLEGIELIRTGSSTNNAFVQSGRIVAGSYDYSLRKGSASGTNPNNWYLTSVHAGVNRNTTHLYRPEAGSYASNLAAASTLFNTRLSDRTGARRSTTDPITGKLHQTNVWIRTVGGHNKGLMSDGQSRYTANRQVLQLGGDVLGGSLANNDAWRVGVMGGYGQQRSTTYNVLSAHDSRGDVSGYSLGLYGTWRQNIRDDSGLYIDSWMIYSWMNNIIKGEQLSGEKYKSRGVTASIETGYEFLAGSQINAFGSSSDFRIRPQAQLIWSGVKANGHTEFNGTQVQTLGRGNVQTRLGVRLSLRNQNNLVQRHIEPFIEVNWLHNARKYGVRMGNADSYIDGRRNLGEIKVGVEGHINKNISLWTNIAYRQGSQTYRDTTGTIGVKYKF